jgi:hypothetical protein
MADNAIASGSVILTANADGLTSGLDKAATGVKSWATNISGALNSTFNAKGGTLGAFQHIGTSVTNQLAGLASKAKSLLSGAGTAIGTMIGGPIGGAIGAAVGSAVGTLGETVAGAIAAPFEKLDLFANINKQAKSLGISASQFQGLTAVMGKAGIEGNQVAQVFTHMGKLISDVASGHGKGAALAFEQLGLSATQLAGMKPDQQLLAIADAFAKLPPGGAQASAAAHLFGDSIGTALLPELQKGSAGMQGLIDTMKRTGAVMADDQIAAGANASKAWKTAKNEIKQAWDGLANRASLIAAPVIEFVGKAVSKVFSMLLPVFDWVGRAVMKVTQIVTVVFEQIEKWFTEGVTWVQNLGKEFFDWGAGMPTVEEAVVGMFRAVGTAAAYVWDVIKLGAGVGYTAIGGVVKAYGQLFKVVSDGLQLLKELPEEIRPKWLDGAVDSYKVMADKVDMMGDKMLGWGKEGLATGLGDSAKMFNKWLDDALKKKQKLDEPTPNSDMLGGPKGSTPKFAAALASGSKEAYSMVLKNQFGANGSKDIAKEQLKEAKKANKIGEKGVKEAEKTNSFLGALGAT